MDHELAVNAAILFNPGMKPNSNLVMNLSKVYNLEEKRF